MEGVSAGGSRNHLNTFHLNPQYSVTLTDPDEEDDTDLCCLVVSLIQKRERNQDDDQLLSIGTTLEHSTYDSTRQRRMIRFIIKSDTINF